MILKKMFFFNNSTIILSCSFHFFYTCQLRPGSVWFILGPKLIHSPCAVGHSRTITSFSIPALKTLDMIFVAEYCFDGQLNKLLGISGSQEKKII